MIVATFKGKDGSCGFIFGKAYNLETEINDNLLWIKNERHRLLCCYSSVESFLANWDILKRK